MDKVSPNPSEGKSPRLKTPKSLAVIDQNGCTGCEVCIDFCPVDCIEIAPNKEYNGLMNLVEVDLERCIGCVLCVNYCPWETIEMIKTDEAETFAKENTIRSVLYDIGENDAT